MDGWLGSRSFSSRWQVRLTPCLSHCSALDSSLLLLPLRDPLRCCAPPPQTARVVVATRRRRVTRRSVRDSGDVSARSPLPPSPPPTLLPWLAPSALASLPFQLPPRRPPKRVPLLPHLARAPRPPAVGASTAHGPGLQARLRRGPCGLLPALPPTTACSAPGGLLGCWALRQTETEQGRNPVRLYAGALRRSSQCPSTLSPLP